MRSAKNNKSVSSVNDIFSLVSAIVISAITVAFIGIFFILAPMYMPMLAFKLVGRVTIAIVLAIIATFSWYAYIFKRA